MRALACVALAGVLAGCAAAPPLLRSGDPVAGDAAQRVRARALGLETGACAMPGWTLAGRVALSNGRQGGSGRIEWVQGGGAVRLLLSAPVTRQSWVLEVAADGRASLQGVADATLSDTDGARLLRETTGWDIPVAALGCWLRGVAAPDRFGLAWFDFGADLLPRRIEQGGWTIDYDDWRPDPFSRLPMPSRIEARRGSDRVRLVVDRWGLE